MLGDSRALEERCILRPMLEPESMVFAEWEILERPYPWNTQHFLDTMDLPYQETLVLADGEKPLGYAVVQVIQTEAYLLNIMVDPLRRGEGAGRLLLAKVLEWSRQKGAVSMFLDVDPLNVAAVRLYTALGFEKAGQRLNAYPRGEGAILMKRTL